MSTVDLSLPTNAQLLATSSPNPEVEATKVTRGDPAQVGDVGFRLQRAGTELDRVHQDSTQTQRVLAGAFANNGAPVYDAQTHSNALPSGFADSGTRLFDAGRRVGVVAEELDSAIDDVTTAQTRTFQTLDNLRRSFAAQVQAAIGPGGLIPEAQVPALQARRAALTTQMQDLVNACGREVVTRVGQYETVLQGCQQLLGELGLSPGLSAGGRGGFPGAQLEGQLGPEILGNPVPQPGTPDRGFTPPVIGLDGPLITVPGPGDTGVVDGPGSAPGVPPIHIDAAKPGTPVPPPKGPLPGFPGAVRVPPKGGVRGGGGSRPRWKLPDGTILEWDRQHGEIEKYDKRGKHQGAFDPDTGEQKKEKDPKRKVEP